MKTTEIEGDPNGEWEGLTQVLGIDGPGAGAVPVRAEKPSVKLGPVLVKSANQAAGGGAVVDDGSAQDKQSLLNRGWAVLPESYRMPKTKPSLEEARAWCRNLAETHYENFHVASWFLPKAFRPHFQSIYAYCRVSDDLGDEAGDPEVALALLDAWGEDLDYCYAGRTRHPVFVALAETIKECSIPKEPFADLLTAFRQDQTVTRYRTMDDVLEYCKYSANPVGRLVLYATGEAEVDREEKFRLSDATCTALQLANFWQDVREDWGRGRVYLPQADMEFFQVTETTIAEGIATDNFRGLLRTEVEYARQLFKEGLPLIGMVDRELAIDLDLFSRGGLEILRAIEDRGYDVLSKRPAIGKGRKAGLAMRAVAAKLLPFLSLGTGAALSDGGLTTGAMEKDTPGTMSLAAAYAECRAIARREAKNFYYAFVALPEARRNAICAIYAFMRKADDLADDESISRAARRAQLDSWLGAWHAASKGDAKSDPVFMAVKDATERFSIPGSLLDELVAGVTMDLETEASAEPDTYATFSDLYRYCYLVASVVGLVCIRIFGYSDPRAEKLAEETGIAFQLTNILRDVAEDAQRGRVYLPQEMMAMHGVTVEDLLGRTAGIPPSENERALLKEMGVRAEQYYKSAQQLLPLIDRESRPALWVLVRIYHGLLKRIEAANYDVFSRRASVPMVEKLAILAGGMARIGWTRMFG